MSPQESGQTASADADDMFGPLPAPTRARVPIISPRLRAHEERKRVIKLCSLKLESMEDPARDLRRSVCINNTYCRLSEEARREKEARRGGGWGRALASVESELAAVGAAPPPPRDLQPPQPPPAKRARLDDCLALLDAIPELAAPLEDCASLARRHLPALPGLLALLDA